MSLAFADKGPGYFSNTTPAERVEDLLKFYGLSKWGFVVYRCTCGDDARWARFMTRLNTNKDHVLREIYHKPELADALEWSVQEDPSLDGATKDEVRRRFRKWVNSKPEIPNGLDDFKKQFFMRENPRYNYCIHVDSDAMESVTPQPPVIGGPEGPMSGYVNVVRADENWDLPDFDRFDWHSYESSKACNVEDKDYSEDEDEDDYDEGEPEIEGSRLHDVGWMMVDATTLVPETYSTFIKSPSWDRLYCRPPKILER
ncbi:hypothetical protein KC363_g6156 [Hortaea werneckii]|uniref:Uncharacterized protein n=1 Tax=Hortaea werneckii TaxID=91943 RepID=A0A3M7FBF6_HORWE|nr:hypothetical protein KC361_g4468 [Hortaea werneckii]KAI7187195.1 hypothetical protein KC363_g6156 [Hortaea werneckii]KAI7507208.1 hypothetical protein KC347_g7044 [Hortaea werneckii]RMY85936.1 hypothetical protein D0861_06218 [Hortaea werneckii]